MRKLKLDELGRKDATTFKTAKKFPVVLVLDNIRSAQNVGSLFRTADAFALHGIILTGITARPPHKEIFKTALGAAETVDWEYIEEPETVISILNKRGFEIIPIEQTDESVSLSDLQISREKKYAFVFGNEVEGVSDCFIEQCKMAIEVPQFGTKHSLNVAVCGGILIYTVVEKLK